MSELQNITMVISAHGEITFKYGFSSWYIRIRMNRFEEPLRIRCLDILRLTNHRKPWSVCIWYKQNNYPCGNICVPRNKTNTFDTKRAHMHSYQPCVTSAIGRYKYGGLGNHNTYCLQRICTDRRAPQHWRDRVMLALWCDINGYHTRKTMSNDDQKNCSTVRRKKSSTTFSCRHRW